MAENRIEYQDFIDPKLVSELDKLEKKLLDIDKTLTHMKEGQGEFVDPKGFSEYQKELEKLNQKIKEAEGLEKERLKIELQRVQVQTKIAAAEAGYTKELEIQRQKLAERNKEIRDEIKNGKMASDSIKALREQSAKWRKEMDLISTSTKEGKKQLEEYRKKIDKNTEAINNAIDADRKRISGIGKYKQAFEGAIATIGAFAAAAYAVYEGLKSVIDTRAQFEKFEAVLTNALGSKSKAVEGMKMITEFASKTPFAIDELTDSYVKLVNRGFIPTKNEMTKLGDLASSTGKSFDQLIEALLDAQTGEMERLKEFGITSKKSGDNVFFTFKGVQTQVKNTDEEIKKYILSLGELKGVTGSMAAISDTLGGKISNLGDSWTTFLNTIGKGGSQAMEDVIDFLKMIVEGATKVAEKLPEVLAKTNASIGGIVEATKMVFKSLYEIAIAPLSKIADLVVGVFTLDVNKIKEAYNRELPKYSDIGGKVATAYEFGYIEAMKPYEKQKLDLQKESAVEAEKIAKKATEDAVKKAKEAAKEKEMAEKEMLSEMKKAYDDYYKYLEKKREKDLISAIEVPIKKQKTIEEESKTAIDALAKRNKKEAEIQQNEKDEDKRIFDIKKESRQQVFDESVAFANALFELGASQRENELQDIENKRQYELELAGDNEKKKAEVNKKYDREEAKIKTDQAKADKAKALFDIAINTAKGIMAAWANPFAAPALIPLIIGTGIVQAAAVAAKKIPKFKTGVIDFKGAGTETSDSNIVAISKGESVIKASSTKKAKNLLAAINSDGSKEQLIKAFLSDAGGLGGTVEAQRINYNDKFDRLIKQNEKLINVLSSKNNGNFDSWKVGKMIEKNQQTIIERNKYLK